MSDQSLIQKFASDWLSKFRDFKSTGRDLAEDTSFAEACFSFNFIMDCGEAFIARFSSEAFYDFQSLAKIIDQVDNLHLIGSAIFSKWRYYNHWAYSNDIETVENRAWFIIALNRLEMLAFSNELFKNQGDLIFCSVVFDEGGKSYYYLTEDDTLKIGDLVCVPVGTDGGESIAEVVKIEYFAEEDAPFPLNKMKSILRKCTEEDLVFEIPDEKIEVVSKESEELDPISNESTFEESQFDFGQLVLCNETTPSVTVYVKAELTGGCLRITGQDFGASVEKYFGKDEYEYFYDFDFTNTEKLFDLIRLEGEDIKGVLLQKFGGMNGCRALREYCTVHDLKYRFYAI